MQVLGGILGAGTLYFIATGKSGFNINDGFALNGFGSRSPDGYNILSCAITEGVFTALLVFTALSTTTKNFENSFKGLVLGGLLIAIHLITIPVTGTSVNFARSLGVAIFAGGEAMTQLWLFAAAQFAGTFVGFTFFKKIHEEDEFESELGNDFANKEQTHKIRSSSARASSKTSKPTAVKSATAKRKVAASRRK
jgi:aquaporin Z